MTSTQTITPLDVPLRHRFADDLPELARPWRAEERTPTATLTAVDQSSRS